MTKVKKRFRTLCVLIAMMLVVSVGLIACGRDADKQNVEQIEEIPQVYKNHQQDILRQFKKLIYWAAHENTTDVDMPDVNFAISFNYDDRRYNTSVSYPIEEVYTFKNDEIVFAKSNGKYDDTPYGPKGSSGEDLIWTKSIIKKDAEKYFYQKTAKVIEGVEYDGGLFGTGYFTQEGQYLYGAKYELFDSDIRDAIRSIMMLDGHLMHPKFLFAMFPNFEYFNKKIYEDNEKITYKLNDSKAVEYGLDLLKSSMETKDGHEI